MKDNLKKVVVIGGGSGSSVALKGLKNYDIDITAIVTMFDSGGSTGILSPDRLIAYLTGIGLVIINNALNKGNISKC